MVLLRKPSTTAGNKVNKKVSKYQQDGDSILESELNALPRKFRAKARKITLLFDKAGLLSLDVEGRFIFPPDSVDIPKDLQTSYYHVLLHWFLSARKAAGGQSQPIDADQFERLVIRRTPGAASLISADKLHNGRRRKKQSVIIEKQRPVLSFPPSWIKL